MLVYLVYPDGAEFKACEWPVWAAGLEKVWSSAAQATRFTVKAAAELCQAETKAQRYLCALLGPESKFA